MGTTKWCTVYNGALYIIVDHQMAGGVAGGVAYFAEGRRARFRGQQFGTHEEVLKRWSRNLLDRTLP